MISSPDHYLNKAQQLAQTTPNSFYINQYHSLHNATTHHNTIGPEIWEKTQGHINIFVSIAGSGGTISRVGRYLKEKTPDIKVIAVDPTGSIYHSYFTQGTLLDAKQILPSLVEGVGADHLNASMDFL